MAPRTTATGLTRLLNSAAGPVYVLDDQQRLVFLNRACADWLGCAADDLLGLECRYHSSPEVTGPASIAAALAPPCEVWSGQRASGLISLAVGDGMDAPRRVEFVPIGNDAVDASGVIALVASAPLEPGDVGHLTTAATPGEESAAELHQRLRQWRRKLAGRYHMDRLVGDTPMMHKFATRSNWRRRARRASRSSGPQGVADSTWRMQFTTAVFRWPPASLRRWLVRCWMRHCSNRRFAVSRRRTQRRCKPLRRRPRPSRDRRPCCWPMSINSTWTCKSIFYGRSPVSVAALRLISTSREPLAVLAARGKFRPDLACALSTVEIRLPRLADRIEDAPLLAQMFVEEANRRGMKQISGLSDEALDRLVAYPWPGNVSELAQAIDAAHAKTDGPKITPADLPQRIQLLADATARPRKQDETIDLERFMASIEEELIRRALARAGGNKAKAARLLGMTRPRLYRRLVQLGLEAGPPDEEG